MKRIIGICLVAAPFTVVTGFMVADLGWIITLSIWTAVAICAAMFVCGIALLNPNRGHP